jgi:hypothetical protein
VSSLRIAAATMVIFGLAAASVGRRTDRFYLTLSENGYKSSVLSEVRIENAISE